MQAPSKGFEPSDPGDEAQHPVRLGGPGGDGAPSWLGQALRAGLPDGRVRCHGVELDLTQGEALVVSPGAVVEIPVGALAREVVLATCCAPAAVRDWDRLSGDLRHERELAAVGEPVADLEIRFADGTAPFARTLRRRFETAPATVWYGFLPYLARGHRADHLVPRPIPGSEGESSGERTPSLWLAALANPYPDREIASIVVRGRNAELLVAAVTRWQRPEPALSSRREVHVAIDGDVDDDAISVVDGIVLRRYRVDLPDPATWLGPGVRGFGGERLPTQRLIVELAASPAARVRVGGVEVSLGEVGDGESRPAGGLTVTRLPLPSLRLRLRPREGDGIVPGRVHARAADGRELQPENHSRVVHDAWTTDRGTDAVRRGWRYAYVDGDVDLLVPPGDVFVEFVRGPAHEVVRTIVPAAEGAAVDLAPRRIADPRADGWLASDTHVHFLDPMAAHRQARAEELELVHLMSAQWGDIFTNVADLARGPVVASGDAVVWVGTENRHHILGHYLAVGTPEIRPLSSGGPNTSTIADPTRMTVADWATATRADGGLAIFPHFPYPDLESVADLLCGKLDAVEVLFDPLIDGRRLREWYRFLNLGVRIPAVTGTDKMGPSGILGEIRTYVHTGSPEIEFEAWAAAVRAGRTVVSVATLFDFRIDDLLPGATLPDAASHACRWRIASAAPLHSIEIVANGTVVHRQELSGPGPHEGEVRLQLPGRGWVAGRCAGPVIEDLPDGGIFEGLQIGGHSSPHYFARPAQPDPVEVERLRVRLEGARAWGERLADWESDAVRDRFEALVAAALGVLAAMRGDPA